MPRLSARFGGTLLAVTLLAAPLAATTLVKMSHEDLARSAELVLTGRCTQVESTWVGRSLVTVATVQVTDAWKGAPGSTVTVVLPGGSDTRGRVPIAQTWPDAPRLTPGQDAVLFLNRRADVAQGFAVTGYSQGAFAIVTSPQGQKMITRDLRGVKLAEDGKVVQGGAVVTSLAEFKSEIQGFLKNVDREQRQR